MLALGGRSVTPPSGPTRRFATDVLVASWPIRLAHIQLSRPESETRNPINADVLKRPTRNDEHERLRRTCSFRPRDPGRRPSIDVARPGAPARMGVPVAEVGGDPARPFVGLSDPFRLPSRVRSESEASVLGIGPWSHLLEYFDGGRVFAIDEAKQDPARLEWCCAARFIA